MKINNSRRQFGKNVGALGLSALSLNALGITGLLSSSNALAASDDYKALVYVFLNGGNDSFNMVLPKESGSLRTRYEQGRSVIALPAGPLHSLNLRSDALISSGEPYNGFGMHANCGDLATMFNAGEMGILSNVGNIIEPTNRNNINDPSHQLPPQLFSHSDQKRQIVSQPSNTTEYGWGGRVAELLSNENTDQNVSPLISIAGLNTFQITRDRLINTYATTPNGPATPSSNFNGVKRDMVEGLMGSSSFDLFSQRNREVYASGTSASATIIESFNIADNSSVDYDGIFSAANANGRLGDQLQAVAKLINGRQATTNNRPVYFVNMSGFDHHNLLLEGHAENMAELNNALKAFRDVLIEQGDFDNTLTHIGSEFGRTFTPNSSGTDHGWGGHMMVMGGAVNGGHLFGRYPDLQLGGERDADSRDRGRWIPQTSTQQTAAVMSNWFGVRNRDLEGIFPTLANFEDSFGANANLNFMQQGT